MSRKRDAKPHQNKERSLAKPSEYELFSPLSLDELCRPAGTSPSTNENHWIFLEEKGSNLKNRKIQHLDSKQPSYQLACLQQIELVSQEIQPYIRISNALPDLPKNNHQLQNAICPLGQQTDRKILAISNICLPASSCESRTNKISRSS
jgi:hypothetical protein